MKLIKILDTINQFEKSSFLKIVDNISNNLRPTNPDIEQLLSENEGQLKDINNANLVKLFKLIKEEFFLHVREKLRYNNFQLDILIDIMIRDGNAIMSREWFYTLYKAEIEKIKQQVAEYNSLVANEKSELSSSRKRDYRIFHDCVQMAYENDQLYWGREKNITREEQSILTVLAKSLELSATERRMIYYSNVEMDLIEADTLITSLKELGIAFFVKKDQNLYIPDEIIWSLRKLLNIDLSDKHYRRILRKLTDGEIGRIARKHSIDRKLDRETKIKHILTQGTPIKDVLLECVHKEEVSKTEKRDFLQDLVAKRLKIELERTGVTAEERMDRLIEYFSSLEQDENLGMATEGFEKLLNDLKESELNTDQLVSERIKAEFELQQDEIFLVDLFMRYNIKPLDILYLFNREELQGFCEQYGVKIRGNLRLNIMENYKDTKNLYLESFDLIARRDINALHEKGITLKESELGIKFEELTKEIFTTIGFEVDEKLRKKMNTKRDKMDILLTVGENEVIIVECKTQKDKDYNKYTSVTRQLRAYEKLCAEQSLKVNQVILVGPEFSEDFINECEYEPDLSLSLLTAAGLHSIMEAYKDSTRKDFPTKLLYKGGMLDAGRIASVISK